MTWPSSPRRGQGELWATELTIQSTHSKKIRRSIVALIYLYRSATIGSTLVARRAGIQRASNDTHTHTHMSNAL
jgi:hypothetical protein